MAEGGYIFNTILPKPINSKSVRNERNNCIRTN